MRPYPIKHDRVVVHLTTGIRHYLGLNRISTLMCGRTMVGSPDFAHIKESVHATCLGCVAQSL